MKRINEVQLKDGRWYVVFLYDALRQVEHGRGSGAFYIGTGDGMVADHLRWVPFTDIVKVKYS